ncbi:type I restriction endonuclease subunit R [Thermomonas sp.]|uniref:type I restriction endonuclease subunit R n=1 Tax=Thermomonas sp. TaxID=1971895 RepID=UPI0035AF8029
MSEIESASPDFPLSEAGGAQLQALHTLSALGWHYLPRAEVERQRGNRRNEVLLQDVLRKQLSRINRIRYDGRNHPFSEENLHTAIQRLREQPFQGLLRNNEAATDLLQLGISLPQRIDNLQREWSLRYMDWDDWQANAFHMAAEFPVETVPGQVVRPDIVLFVNGIPFAVIEVKSPREDVLHAISQQLRNQKQEDGAPGLFHTVQLLVAAQPNTPRYATVGTPAKLWAEWKELDIAGEEIGAAINRPLDAIEEAELLKDFAAHQRRHRAVHEAGGRYVTEQDRLLTGLCRPERLLELARRFVLFDGPFKKIARHPQFFTVRHLLQRVQKRDDRQRREGGVVWHTQGSGKSLTMVMLAKSLAMDVRGARIVMVTDRTDLDDQIRKTFRATGLEPVQARTGEHLLELLEAKAPVVTTLIHKFRAGLNKRKLVDDSADIFVLIDESHRSQYGDIESLHARMREGLPNACVIGFTGTPLAKKERNTFLKFGPLVQPAYTLTDAVAEGAVVPLLYEGRLVEQDIDANAIDAWFERSTRELSDARRAELKKSMSKPTTLMGVSDWLRCVAFDAGRHYVDNFQGSGLKGQVAVPSKRDAVLLKRLFDEIGEVRSEVVISAPDMREDESAIDESTDSEVKEFWKKMMQRYGDEAAYNRQIVDAFKGPEGPELLIVVSKLLTGFDAPRNTVLYLARPLKEHTLLQAIARVNRVFEETGAADKPYGYIIDYCGVLTDLSDALSSNAALADFDEADLANAVSLIRDRAARLPQQHAELLDVFAGVSNRYDEEAYARHLADEALRATFYRALSNFRRGLEMAQVSREFLEDTPPERLRRWRGDQARFEALRASVRARYSEKVADWDEYKKQLRRLLDRYVTSHEVTTVVEPLPVFDDKALAAASKQQKRTDASVADEIASRTLREIDEKWDEDPVFYEKFSKLIKDTIDAFRQHRLDEKAYLEAVRKHRDGVTHREGDEEAVPTAIRGKGHETAFWGIARRELENAGLNDETLPVRFASVFAEAVATHRIIGWQTDEGVRNRIRAEVDTFYFDELGAPEALTPDVLDAIVDQLMDIATIRMPDDGRIR